MLYTKETIENTASHEHVERAAQVTTEREDTPSPESINPLSIEKELPYPVTEKAPAPRISYTEEDKRTAEEVFRKEIGLEGLSAMFNTTNVLTALGALTVGVLVPGSIFLKIALGIIATLPAFFFSAILVTIISVATLIFKGRL